MRLEERVREPPDQLEWFIQLISSAQQNFKKRRKDLMNKHSKITKYFPQRAGLTKILEHNGENTPEKTQQGNTPRHDRTNIAT